MPSSSVCGLLDGKQQADVDSASSGYPSYRDIPAVGELRNYLALDGSSSGTRADLSELDVVAASTDPSANFFRSVVHVAPFIPSVGPIVEESAMGGSAVDDAWQAESTPWSDYSYVLKQVKMRGRALQFATPSLKRDLHVVLAAVQTHPSAIWFAAPSVRRHEDVLKAVSAKGYEPIAACLWDRMTDEEQKAELETSGLSNSDISQRVWKYSGGIEQFSELHHIDTQFNKRKARLATELRRIHFKPLKGCSVKEGCSVKDDGDHWSLSLLVSHITIDARMHFPDGYPSKPPKVHFITQVDHPLIDAQGSLSLRVLTSPPVLVSLNEYAELELHTNESHSHWKSSYQAEDVIAAILTIFEDTGLKASEMQAAANFTVARSMTARHLLQKQLKVEFPSGADPVPTLAAAVQTSHQRRHNLCMYGKECSRTGCHFNHPDGHVPETPWWIEQRRMDRLEWQWRRGDFSSD